jgi:hypothetical protein
MEQKAMKTGSYCVFALDRKEDRRGKTQPPLLVVGIVAGLYEYKSRKHAALVDTREPNKLSFISAKLWVPVSQHTVHMYIADGLSVCTTQQTVRGETGTLFSDCEVFKGKEYHFHSHMEPSALVHVFDNGVMKRDSETGYWRLSKDALDTFEAINKVGARLGLARKAKVSARG